MDIDPNNLGPIVYKEEQVITKEDLEGFISDLQDFTNENDVDPESLLKTDAVISCFEILHDWISNNKQMTIVFFKEDDMEDLYED